MLRARHALAHQMPPGIVTEAMAQSGKRVPGAEAVLWRIVYRWITQLAQAVLAGDGQRHWIAAEDLVHEAFLRVRPAYLQRAGLRRSGLQALVVRAMRQALIDESRRKRPHFPGELEAPADHPDPSLDLLDLRDRLGRLAGCCGIQRRIVDLHVFEGWSFAQIEKELGCGATWARAQYHAAILRLRGADVVDHGAPLPLPLGASPEPG